MDKKILFGFLLLIALLLVVIGGINLFIQGYNRIAKDQAQPAPQVKKEESLPSRKPEVAVKEQSKEADTEPFHAPGEPLLY